jgi:hypothetical protein
VTQPNHTQNQLLRELAALIRTHGLAAVVRGLAACCRWAGHQARAAHRDDRALLWDRAAASLEWCERSCTGLGPKG